jgi:CRP-like cAMP-binding protein
MERKMALTVDLGDKTKTFIKGQVIFKEGQPSNEAYVIKQGQVSLYRVIGNKRVNISLLGPGQIFGEMGVISGEKRDASADALDHTELLVLDPGLLQTLLLKSPRPVQIITGYLMQRVRDLDAKIKDSPCPNMFLSVSGLVLMCYRVAQARKPDCRDVNGKRNAQLSTVEVSKTIKDILLITQVEIDDILDKLAKLHIIEFTDIKGAHYRKDPLLGTVKKTADFVKERMLEIPDEERFAQVIKHLAKDPGYQDAFPTDLEFYDLQDFAKDVEAQPETIMKKIAYGEIPPEVFFFHKSGARMFAQRKGRDFFKQAKRPRLNPKDIQSVEDVLAVDNSTLEEALSKMGFYKVSVLAALAGDEARQKIFHNLSKKIALVVKEEMARMADLDDSEAADIEGEFINTIKTMKGL